MKNLKNKFKSTIANNKLLKNGTIKKDVTLKDLTSFKIGGSADFFFEPNNEKELVDGLNLFLENKIPLYIIGGGNNLLISDKGLSGAVLSLKKFNKIDILSDIKNSNSGEIFVRAGAGVSVDDIVSWAIENSVLGFENFSGLPSLIGGACFMNARCYGISISDIIYSAKFFYIENFVQNSSCIKFDEYFFDKNDWGYKKSPFQINATGIKITDNRQIVLSAIFKLKKGDRQKIMTKAGECKNDRITKGHFKAPSAGSTFKNNRDFGNPSGKIIEETNLKGFSVGDAQVAPWHGNFVINKNNASFDDVLQLIDYIQKKVKEKTGFLLEPEVIICKD